VAGDLTIWPTLLEKLPPLRMLLVPGTLAGHKTPKFVCRLFAHGIMPLYTPVGGSCPNMAESIRRIIKRRAQDGRHPTAVVDIMGCFEAVTPIGTRPRRLSSGALLRIRQEERRHGLGGSGA
jgi:hypothetical protein